LVSSPVTLPTGADEAGGPPSFKFYELRDNLTCCGICFLTFAPPLVKFKIQYATRRNVSRETVDLIHQSGLGTATTTRCGEDHG
jgi:hypothetical protein